MSFKAEVIADSSGQWAGNALRFATREEADEYGHNLEGRWMMVRDVRVVECSDPVNYKFVDGKLIAVPREEKSE